MTPPPPETRRHKRFAVDVEAVVQARSGSFTARTRDLSRSGICLITSQALSGSEWVVIELVLAFGENTFSEPLRLDARVVWCTPIGSSFQVGAMFNTLSEENTDFLEMFLRYLDGSMTPRGQATPSDDDDPDRDPTPPPDVKDDPFRH